MRKITFKICVFNRCNFEFADLIEDNFNGSSLNKVNLAQSNCTGACFSYANLRESNLKGACCEECSFENANLLGVKWDRTSMFSFSCFNGARMSFCMKEYLDAFLKSSYLNSIIVDDTKYSHDFGSISGSVYFKPCNQDDNVINADDQKALTFF